MTISGRRWIVPLVMLLTVLSVTTSRAQTIAGVVVEGSSGEGLAGAVVLLFDNENTERGAALTQLDGRFEIQAPEPGTYRLRVERIGHASTNSAPLTVVDGQRLETSLLAPIEAIELTGIEVVLDHPCEVRPEASRYITVVWEEARKALVAAYLTQHQRLYRFELSEHRRLRDPRSLRIEDEALWIRSDRRPDSPYVSRSAREFARLGYADVHDDHVQYYGPDAAALVSDSFLDRHCFRLVEKHGPRGLLGIAFSPLRGHERVDIEGVLWVDRVSGELDHLEFRYVGLPWRHRTAVATGRVDYRRLAGGGWIIGGWWLRAPLFRDSLGHGPVVAIKEVGGEVTAVKGPEVRSESDDRSQT
jgi:hypothetical protein